ADLTYQHSRANMRGGGGDISATSASEPSLHSHWISLREGVRTMIDHPQGYGLGNVGQTASRTDTKLLAGESNYTELGVELGVLGAVVWTAWGVWLLRVVVRCGAAAAVLAVSGVLVVARQYEEIGLPGVSYVV